jgi:hypothetical protein
MFTTYYKDILFARSVNKDKITASGFRWDFNAFECLFIHLVRPNHVSKASLEGVWIWRGFSSSGLWRYSKKDRKSQSITTFIGPPPDSKSERGLCIWRDQTSWGILQELWSGKLSLPHMPAEVCTLMYFPNFYKTFLWYQFHIIDNFRMIHSKRKLLSDDAVLGFENAMIIWAR